MANHLIFIIMDSCRYDSFVRAQTPNMDRLGKVECRWSYASWTAPSHYALLMGLMPHLSPQHVFASEVYKKDFTQWIERLDIPDLSFKSFLPAISLPKVLSGLGYRCTARVSMPVLNSFTLLAKYFDDYKLMDNHNDFATMIEQVKFPDGELQFYFLNLGETHYPYMLSDENLPRVHGVHGVFKSLAAIDKQPPDNSDGFKPNTPSFFDQDLMEYLHQQQIFCVEYVDKLAGDLFKKCPPNTHFIITSDHGELFGENGYFGHGPIMHEKVFEVPFIEGRYL